MGAAVTRHPERRAAGRARRRRRRATAGQRDYEYRRESGSSHRIAFERTAPLSVAARARDGRRRRPNRCGRRCCGRPRAAVRRSRAWSCPCRPGRARGSSCASAPPRSESVGGPPLGPKVAQYQSTWSPSSSVTLSAPTGGETPFTLKTQPVVAPADVAADLVDVGAERRARDVVVELAGRAGRVERVERVRLDRERRLGRAVDRLRLALHAHVHAQGEGRGDDEQRRHEDGEENNETLGTNPPSARGSGLRRAAGLLTRGSLRRRLPGS